jgi:hypothetical protein
MDLDRIYELFRGLPFREAVWVVPLVTGLHFLEEAPRFAKWASTYALKTYTRERWRQIHGLGMLFTVAFCALVSAFPRPAVVFLFFAFCLSEMLLNTLFHIGATAFYSDYCPGLITALVLYPPLFSYLSELAHREALLTNPLGLIAFAIASVVHSIDVATSVFGLPLHIKD